jgi:predicted AAA+ superfamily ATPase
MEISDLYIKSTRLVSAINMEHIRSLYDTILWDSRMICIKGARGVGKTTLMLQRIKKEKYATGKALYVSLDDLWFTDHRLLELVDYHYTHGGTHIFIDEVHRYPYPNWTQELKNIYDSYPGLHVVFSGSSILNINMSQADLSRRCLFYHLPGLSFREYISFEGKGNFDTITLEDIISRHTDIEQEIAPQLKVLPLLEDYLQKGYYPIYKEVPEAYHIVLQQMISTIIDVDLPSVEDIEHLTLAKMKRLLVIISKTVPFSLNASKIGASIETSRQMVVRMLSLLNNAALLTVLYSGKNKFSQLAKPEKIYFDNTNLMYSLSSDIEIGTVRETFFANQLKQQHELAFSGTGDFLIDEKYTFEVGGNYKTFGQIKDQPDSYLAIGDIEYGHLNRIPIWLFGFLY